MSQLTGAMLPLNLPPLFHSTVADRARVFRAEHATRGTELSLGRVIDFWATAGQLIALGHIDCDDGQLIRLFFIDQASGRSMTLGREDLTIDGHRIPGFPAGTPMDLVLAGAAR